MPAAHVTRLTLQVIIVVTVIAFDSAAWRDVSKHEGHADSPVVCTGDGA